MSVVGAKTERGASSRQRLLARARIVAKSAGVGAVATVVDLAVLALLVDALGVSPRAASIPALASGVAVQFMGNKLFAFQDRTRAWLTQGGQFAGVEALGFGLNVVLFDAIVSRTALPYIAVRCFTTAVVYFGFCLPLWSRIFTAGTQRTPTTAHARPLETRTP